MKDQLSSKYLATWFTSDKWLIIKMVNKFFQSWIHAHTKLVPLRLSQPGHVEMLYGVFASETYKLLLTFQILIPLDKRKETKYTLLTRKHSSRVRTCLPTIDGHATKCQYGWWGYQVSCWGGGASFLGYIWAHLAIAHYLLHDLCLSELSPVQFKCEWILLR